MKERIKRNLNNIQELDDRKLLKEVMNYVFNGMIDYTDMVYETIRKRVFDEINLDDARKPIYTTICYKEKYDLVDDFMFPMFQEDLNEELGKTDWIIEKLKNKESVILGKTFLACDYLKIQQLKGKENFYPAKLVTEQGSYDVTIQLQKNTAYTDKIRNLYYNYQQNNLHWISVNAPYLYKIFDFVLAGPVVLEEGEEIQRLEVSLGEWDKFRNDNVIPLWNLEEIMLISTNFPIATGENLRYQHKFNIPDMETVYDNIIRFEDDYEGYVIRDKESISIIVQEESISSWPAYKIHEPDPQIEYEYGYPILSNAHKENFLVGYSRQQSKVIRTKAELYRQLDAFEISDLFEIKEIEIINKHEGQDETYLVNNFIEEDIRPDDGRKVMVVTYTTVEETYLARDIMSFIISELQQFFPEYKCIGKMI